MSTFIDRPSPGASRDATRSRSKHSMHLRNALIALVVLLSMQMCELVEEQHRAADATYAPGSDPLDSEDE